MTDTKLAERIEALPRKHDGETWNWMLANETKSELFGVIKSNLPAILAALRAQEAHNG